MSYDAAKNPKYPTNCFEANFSVRGLFVAAKETVEIVELKPTIRFLYCLFCNADKIIVVVSQKLRNRFTQLVNPVAVVLASGNP